MIVIVICTLFYLFVYIYINLIFLLILSFFNNVTSHNLMVRQLYKRRYDIIKQKVLFFEHL